MSDPVEQKSGVNFVTCLVAVGVMAFGSFLGLGLAAFLVPGSGLALLFGAVTLPYCFLLSEWIWQMFFDTKLLHLLGKKWHVGLEEEDVDSVHQEQRFTASLFVPVSAGLAGLISLLIAAEVSAGFSFMVLFAFTALGATFGAMCYVLAQFDLLPEITH